MPEGSEETRGDWEGRGAVWGTSVRSEAARESRARGGGRAQQWTEESGTGATP